MNKPNIRFNAFSDSWNNPTIEDLFELRNGYTPSKAVDAFWTNGTIPWFRMEDIRSKGNKLAEAFQKITPEAVKSGGLFKQNSIILATTATIGEHAMLIADSLANQQFTNFKIRKSLECDYLPDFINYAFYKVDEWCLKNTNSGGLLSVDLKGLVKQPFYVPSLLEQNKISSFLRHLESSIECENQKLTSMHQIKSACLQSMFPQEGESVPKVRFKGFNEEWERCNLSDIATFRKGKGYSKSDIESHGTPIILYGSLYTNYNLKISEINSFVNEKVGSYKSEGNEIIVPASGETAEDIARASVVAQKGVILGGDLNIISIDKNSFSPEFVALSITYGQPHKYLTKVAQGKSVVHLHNSDISKICLLCPSLEEQQKIASYFENLDKQISLQTQRLEKLKQIKSACLDNMFV